MTHDDVKSLGDLKGRTILVASSGRTSWWPWMKAKYGYTERAGQALHLQPAAVLRRQEHRAAGLPLLRALPGDEEQRGGQVLPLCRRRLPPYGTTIVTTDEMVKSRPDVIRRFVRASMEGWVSYFKNPGPADELIKKDNPQMSDEQIAFAIRQMKALKVLDGGDAATQGVGVMTEARWQRTFDYLVGEKIIKPETAWRKAFTLQFVKDLRVMP
jgi:NitT/TauT family transport system substrate-binding protein